LANFWVIGAVSIVTAIASANVVAMLVSVSKTGGVASIGLKPPQQAADSVSARAEAVRYYVYKSLVCITTVRLNSPRRVTDQALAGLTT
jgi:hypothetical protein